MLSAVSCDTDGGGGGVWSGGSSQKKNEGGLSVACLLLPDIAKVTKCADQSYEWLSFIHHGGKIFLKLPYFFMMISEMFSQWMTLQCAAKKGRHFQHLDKLDRHRQPKVLFGSIQQNCYCRSYRGDQKGSSVLGSSVLATIYLWPKGKASSIVDHNIRYAIDFTKAIRASPSGKPRCDFWFQGILFCSARWPLGLVAGSPVLIVLFTSFLISGVTD